MSKKKKITELQDPITFIVRVGIYCADHRHIVADWYDIIYAVDFPSQNELKDVYCNFLKELADHDYFSDGDTVNGFIEVAPIIKTMEVETGVSIQKISNGKEQKKYC